MKSSYKKSKIFIILLVLLIIFSVGGYLYFSDDKTVENEEILIEEENIEDVQIPEETFSNEDVLKEEYYEEPIANEDYKIVGQTSKGYDIVLKDGCYYVDDILIVNKTFSLPSDYYPGGLTNEFLSNWYQMRSAAANEGLTIFVKSGFRAYSDQKIIYNNYVKEDGQENADTYSARPGHSEHQTGLAADLNGDYMNFSTTLESKWVKENCYKYGFIIRYPEGKEEITGYIYESWHIRYVGTELATKLYNEGNWITLEEYYGFSSEYQDEN